MTVEIARATRGGRDQDEGDRGGGQKVWESRIER